MDSPSGKKIKIAADGPYVVTGGVPMHQEIIESDERGIAEEWKRGREYDKTDKTYCLCRCGQSKIKPHCDGTHNDTGYVGKENADRPPYTESARLQRGERYSLLDDPSLCVGARFCDKGLQVWGYIENSGDPENAMRAVDEACKCPAGRLTVVDEENRMIEPELPQEIGVVQDPANNCRGPLWVKGGIEIEGARGEKYETRNRVTLCRCGQSRNEPFCDGSHYSCQQMQGSDS